MLASLPAMMLAATAAGANESATGLSLQSGGTYSFTLGGTRVIALSDGTVPADLHQLLLPTTPAHTDALLAESYLHNPVEVSINEWVFKIGNRVVLVDTGAGQLFGAGFGGKVVQSLGAAGFHPDDITDILITHIHTDNSGGLMRGGDIVFSKATVHVGQPDLTFFFDRANAAKVHYDVKYFDEAIRTVKPYLDAGKVKAFDGTTDILPALRRRFTPGTRPAVRSTLSPARTRRCCSSAISFMWLRFSFPIPASQSPMMSIPRPQSQSASVRFRHSCATVRSSQCRTCRFRVSGTFERSDTVSSGCRSTTSIAARSERRAFEAHRFAKQPASPGRTDDRRYRVTAVRIRLGRTPNSVRCRHLIGHERPPP